MQQANMKKNMQKRKKKEIEPSINKPKKGGGGEIND